MGMVQPGEDTGFGEKSLHLVRASEALRVGHLDGEVATQDVIMGAVDDTHPPLANPLQQEDAEQFTLGAGSGSRIGGVKITGVQGGRSSVCESFTSARSQSIRTALGERPIREAISSKATPSRFRKRKTAR